MPVTLPNEVSYKITTLETLPFVEVMQLNIRKGETYQGKFDRPATCFITGRMTGSKLLY
jgi:hypothetical protein